MFSPLRKSVTGTFGCPLTDRLPLRPSSRVVRVAAIRAPSRICWASWAWRKGVQIETAASAAIFKFIRIRWVKSEIRQVLEQFPSKKERLMGDYSKILLFET